MNASEKITEALSPQAHDFDVDAIEQHLLDEFGTADIDKVGSEKFYDIAAQHVRPDEKEAFQEGVVAAIKAAPMGKPAVYTHESVTVSIKGAARPSAHRWPQVLAQLTLSTPDGHTIDIHGESIASLNDLHQKVTDLAEDWERNTDALLYEASAGQSALTRAENELHQARSRRNAAILAASKAGISAYKIAKTLGIAESTVGRLLKTGVGA